MERRFLRAFFHFFLLVLLLSLVLSTVHSCIYAPSIRGVCNNLFEQIGGLRFSTAQGVRTLNTPEQKKSYLLDDNIRFDYCPGNTLTEGDIAKWNTPFGVLCLDRGFLFWADNYADSGKGKFLVIPLAMDLRQSREETFQSGLSGRELLDYARTRFELKKGEMLFLTERLESAVELSDQLIVAFWLMVFSGAFLAMFVVGFLMILFFGVMQYFWSGLEERKLTFPTVLVVLIYTSFPPLLIAALYSFFMVPVFSPQMVFFIAFFVYYIAVFRRIRNSLNPPRDMDVDDDF